MEPSGETLSAPAHTGIPGVPVTSRLFRIKPIDQILADEFVRD
jgi:hypothetical protein